jgi:hypothetical protein
MGCGLGSEVIASMVMDLESANYANELAVTARGAAWLEQFDVSDRETARELLDSLTLISHNEFERALTALVSYVASKLDGPVALFATREFEPTEPFFQKDGLSIDAVAGGNDLGSEARVAALIRNLSRAEPKKYLNHPTIEDMRTARCRGLFVVDDFIGSGERTTEFLSSMWLNATLRSWCSLHLISIYAIAYAATELGRRRVERAKVKPKLRLERDCPTFYDMPWTRARRRKVLSLISRYGSRTSCPGFALGYERIAAALIFEHGCPDNCPAILWAPPNANAPWQPLFPTRSVLPPEASAFPSEILRPDPARIMMQSGQRRLAQSGALSSRGPIGPTVLLVLGLAAKGIRTRAALAHATGLPAGDCGRLFDRCVQWRLLTPTLRLTPAGAAELDYARQSTTRQNKVPSRGVDSYYPQQLRRPVDG